MKITGCCDETFNCIEMQCLFEIENNKRGKKKFIFKIEDRARFFNSLNFLTFKMD